MIRRSSVEACRGRVFSGHCLIAWFTKNAHLLQELIEIFPRQFDNDLTAGHSIGLLQGIGCRNITVFLIRKGCDLLHCFIKAAHFLLNCLHLFGIGLRCCLRPSGKILRGYGVHIRKQRSRHALGSRWCNVCGSLGRLDFRPCSCGAPEPAPQESPQTRQIAPRARVKDRAT